MKNITKTHSQRRLFVLAIVHGLITGLIVVLAPTAILAFALTTTLIGLIVIAAILMFSFIADWIDAGEPR